MNALWFLVLLLGAGGEHTLSAHLSEKECHEAAKVEKVVNYICRLEAGKKQILIYNARINGWRGLDTIVILEVNMASNSQERQIHYYKRGGIPVYYDEPISTLF